MEQKKQNKSGKDYKEMHVKMNKIYKTKRNENSMSNFLSSPFSPVMENLSADSSAGECITDIGKKSLWKESFPRASSEKISCLQEVVSWLNQCIGEKNQGQIETDKEQKILEKGFKKQMKENKSLNTKLTKKNLKLNTRNINKKV